MSYRDVTTNNTRIAIITDDKGPHEHDNYTVLLWDKGAAYKTHSFHIANAAAIADDWCFNSHGGVYVNTVDM